MPIPENPPVLSAGRKLAHRVIDWVWTHLSTTMLFVILGLLVALLYVIHVNNTVDSAQHDTNNIVYQACVSDTQAEKSANVIVGQLAKIVQGQIVIARAMRLDSVVARDTVLLKNLPIFPPLPPCGDKP